MIPGNLDEDIGYDSWMGESTGNAPHSEQMVQTMISKRHKGGKSKTRKIPKEPKGKGGEKG